MPAALARTQSLPETRTGVQELVEATKDERQLVRVHSHEPAGFRLGFKNRVRVHSPSHPCHQPHFHQPIVACCIAAALAPHSPGVSRWVCSGIAWLDWWHRGSQGPMSMPPERTSHWIMNHSTWWGGGARSCSSVEWMCPLSHPSMLPHSFDRPPRTMVKSVDPLEPLCSVLLCYPMLLRNTPRALLKCSVHSRFGSCR